MKTVTKKVLHSMGSHINRFNSCRFVHFYFYFYCVPKCFDCLWKLGCHTLYWPHDGAREQIIPKEVLVHVSAQLTRRCFRSPSVPTGQAELNLDTVISGTAESDDYHDSSSKRENPGI